MRSRLIVAFLAMLCAAPAANQPPIAQFTVAPASGPLSTVFAVDASASTDDRTKVSKLKVRWDWESDGIYDTAYSTTKTAAHHYLIAGPKTIKVEVQDSDGLSSTTTRGVTVLPTLTQALVSGPTGTSYAMEPDVDIDPGNPQRLVISALTGDWAGGPPSVPYPAFASTDGGATWTQASGNSPIRTGDPGIEFDGTGRVFLSAIDDTTLDGDPIGIRVAKSADGGLTYPTRTYAMDANTPFRFPDGTYHTPCVQGSFYIYDYPKLASDKSVTSHYPNNLYVIATAPAFDLNPDMTCAGSSARVFVRSQDAGDTWDSGQFLFDVGLATSSIGVASDGTVYVAQSSTGSSSCASGFGIVVRKSVNGGSSFLPGACAVPGDNSRQTGVTWTAVDPSNPARVYIVYFEDVSASGGSFHVFVTRSSDAGTTWSAPVRVDEVLPDDVVDHYRPSISVSSTGRVDVIWFDYRNSSPKRLTQKGQPGDVYYAYSVDGGITWAASMRLSTSTFPLRIAPGNDFLTVTSAGNKAHAVYAQDTHGNGYWETLLTTVSFD